MKISYNWLKEYIDIDIDYNDLSKILTDIGLEVEGVEEFQSIKGGLEGLIVGEVIEKQKHPNADKLSLTKVDIGTVELLDIVCGAPNVDKGQKVVVAPVGSTLYFTDEPFQLKKTKIRGEVSEGMICAEDEIGVGTSHDGILVLDNDVKVGKPASEYFNVENDIVFEIGLTPNRIDSASHIGVARDLAAFLGQKQNIKYTKPSVDHFKVDNTSRPIEVIIENEEACPRYSGVTVSNITIKESPDWLKNKLKAIGLNPINNVVDITNFVLHETGHPLHAFDSDKVKGNKIIVKTLPDKAKFKTLDEEVRELNEKDLMICNDSEGMCIAGVFGGIDSGVQNMTKSIFIESACFNPVYVRKTAKRHTLATDSSFRFERGVDPNDTIFALKRAALLVKEIAGGEISSEIVDVYPKTILPYEVLVKYKNIHRLIGKEISKEEIKKILLLLEINIENETNEELKLKIPTYRVDVLREADVIEEILRIYGYNNIEIPEHVNGALSYIKKPNVDILRNRTSDYLTGLGFNEIMSNSLTKSGYYDKIEDIGKESLVKIHNPLSADLDVLRNNLLFGGLEAIRRNINRKRQDLKLYEFGHVYFYGNKKDIDVPLDNYFEHERLALFLTGKRYSLNWKNNEETSFYDLKSFVDNLLQYYSFTISDLSKENLNNSVYSDGVLYKYNEDILVRFGILQNSINNYFDIEQEIYFADFAWPNLMKYASEISTEFTELPKFPEVKRDLALLIDEDVSFDKIESIAKNVEKKLIKDIILFDVFKGKNIDQGKKSYAVSFILQDEFKTLTDKQIDKTMNKLVQAYQREINAQIR